ncbi:DUF3307 domain-containing protein [Streptacidiphilus anmyonensis]|uniref:DUF3307 domain-containing protein n=1 Tax=Streptacidiphilus anmyonensis TaxID=405782 RepID=UPI0005AB5D8C|nr:DUF3307 domain-containing protein [Streptacidiphilus anmyonensis]
MFAAVFVLLYIAHLAADYPLQTDAQSAHKAGPGLTGWRANLTHASIHAASYLVLLFGGGALLHLHLGVGLVLGAVAWVSGLHAFIDRRWPITWWMDHTGQAGFRANGGAQHVDQVAHLALGILPAALAMAALT